MKYRVGDSVVVTVGKDKGKSGKIAKIFVDKGMVFIEGINKKIRHMKAREGQEGGRVEIYAPIDMSNILIEDPKTKKPSRVGYRIEKDGSKVRFAKKSGEALPNSHVSKKGAAKTPKK